MFRINVELLNISIVEIINLFITLELIQLELSFWMIRTGLSTLFFSIVKLCRVSVNYQSSTLRLPLHISIFFFLFPNYNWTIEQG